MKVVWTRLAIEDLNSAYEFIHISNPTAAKAIVERIEKAIESLPLYPDMGRPGRIEGTRELAIARTPFVIPYRIRQNQIEILAIVHGARRWPDSF